ncbi:MULTISPECIES: LacI family DNA-binding transcriptional regulator [unclassified Oceanispirochaeta]|uniref:LacI family DNA-binding transcriptional regulator n=1 Tax=unclassified Oceanispirochaeta TaxID=2635722 RepID=UPI000E0908D8|nr:MULTISPECIES: LacI family DNA-binding transcriptional regulator [unclassified Oceanispirochaeta]MBF9018019.1 LacI family DNA-binding transcriptional regulator [Oceanispirochaeta sp. M2]NPD74531.1 LacI family transcriptional regulator [Oceanispirochaeta sp. M1]RDG29643.1 LacI family transcriptional regulator [Oceanispirochaeta sp. M1]
MASMKDVAKLAGVSVSTVSRVISGAMKVEEPTKKKVVEAIRKVDYKPNLMAQGLRIKKGNMIGFIVPEISHPSFVNFINYAEKYASHKSLSLIVCNTHNDPKKAAEAFDNLLRRNINGIILSRVSDESQVLNFISKTDTPVIIIDRALNHENLPNLILDNYKAGKIAAEHFLRAGHRHIACVTGSQKILLVRERLNGFRDTLQENGIVLEDNHVFEGAFTFETGVKAVHLFEELNSDVDAVWAQSDIIAAGLIASYQRIGRHIPEDVAIIGMDDISLSTMIYPTITSIKQPYEEMSRKAVEIIDTLADGGSLDRSHFVFEPELIVRESAP